MSILTNSPFLIVGFIMALYYALTRKYRLGFKTYQIMIFIPLALVCDLFGERLLFFFNYGNWGGHYFYGGVMFLPIFIIPLILILRMNYLKTTDMLAVVAMLVRWIAKIGNCGLINGCCGGIELFEMSNGEVFCFPSQYVEGAVLLAIGIFLMKLSKNEKYRGLLYGYLLIIYGITRAIFESLRIAERVYLYGVAVAQFWCLILVILGVMWIVLVPLYKKKSKRYQVQIEQEKIDFENKKKQEIINKLHKNKKKQTKR